MNNYLIMSYLFYFMKSCSLFNRVMWSILSAYMKWSVSVQWDWSSSWFEYIVSRWGHVRGKPMFMWCSGTFDSVVARKQAKYVTWELIYEFCICYELYKRNIKLYELISIYWVQWLMCSVKVALLGLDNQVWEVGSVLNQKQWELGHSSASYAILNAHVPLLASHIY